MGALSVLLGNRQPVHLNITGESEMRFRRTAIRRKTPSISIQRQTGCFVVTPGNVAELWNVRGRRA
jgi:hypothetical protein